MTDSPAPTPERAEGDDVPTDDHQHGACAACDRGEHAGCLGGRRQTFTVFRYPGTYLCNCDICWPPCPMEEDGICLRPPGECEYACQSEPENEER